MPEEELQQLVADALATTLDAAGTAVISGAEHPGLYVQWISSGPGDGLYIEVSDPGGHKRRPRWPRKVRSEPADLSDAQIAALTQLGFRRTRTGTQSELVQLGSPTVYLLDLGPGEVQQAKLVKTLVTALEVLGLSRADQVRVETFSQ